MGDRWMGYALGAVFALSPFLIAGVRFLTGLPDVRLVTPLTLIPVLMGIAMIAFAAYDDGRSFGEREERRRQERMMQLAAEESEE